MVWRQGAGDGFYKSLRTGLTAGISHTVSEAISDSTERSQFGMVHGWGPSREQDGENWNWSEKWGWKLAEER